MVAPKEPLGILGLERLQAHIRGGAGRRSLVLVACGLYDCGRGGGWGGEDLEAAQSQVRLDADLSQELGLVALLGTLAGLLPLDSVQSVASLLQHPAELAKGVAKLGERVGEGELHLGGGRPERRLDRLYPLQEGSGFRPQGG